MDDSLPEAVIAEITERLTTAVEQQRLPGLAVGIVSGKNLIWHGGFGLVDLASGRHPDADTLFRVASITKTFTSAAILKLRDAGLLSLDDPLEKHLPEISGARANGGSVRGITLRRMLAHRAGLSTEAPLPCWDALRFPSREALLESIPQIEVVIAHGSAFKYSNLAFGLLGEVIARLSGRPYFEYMRSQILQPLGLESTAFELNDQQRERFAVGYSPSSYEDDLHPAPEVPLNGLSACGGLYSSVRDLSRWIGLQFQTGTDSDDNAQILAGRTIEEFHRPQYLEPDWSMGYCLGWRAQRSGDRVYHGHGGGIYGFASQILFSKPHEMGVICLANVWPQPPLPALASGILDVLVASGEESQPARRPIRPTPPELRELLGSYAAGPGIGLNVEYRGDSLCLVATSDVSYDLHVPATLEPTENPWEFLIRGGRGSGEAVVFRPAGESNSMQFEVGGFVYRRLAAAVSWDLE